MHARRFLALLFLLAGLVAPLRTGAVEPAQSIDAGVAAAVVPVSFSFVTREEGHELLLTDVHVVIHCAVGGKIFEARVRGALPRRRRARRPLRSRRVSRRPSATRGFHRRARRAAARLPDLVGRRHAASAANAAPTCSTGSRQRLNRACRKMRSVGYHGDVSAAEPPPPAAVQALEEPDRLAECASDVRDCGISGDDQVEVLDERRRVTEIADRGTGVGNACGACAEHRRIARRARVAASETRRRRCRAAAGALAAGSTCDASHSHVRRAREPTMRDLRERVPSYRRALARRRARSAGAER